MQLFKPHNNQMLLEEWGNASTHMLGALFALVGLVLLCAIAAQSGDSLKWLSSIAFGGGLLLMFSASTLYHFVTNEEIKRNLKVLDHCSIFFLIAGTYTPFMLLTLHSTFSFVLLAVIWFIALAGTLYKCFYVSHYPKLSTFCYLLMGWLAIIAIKPLYQHLSQDSFYWLVACGLSYTIGVIFYLWKRLYFSHAIWHLFVIGGCSCHFWVIYHHVLPSVT